MPQAVAQLNAPIVAQPVRQLDEPPEPLSLLSWSANIMLLEKLKDPAAALCQTLFGSAEFRFLY